jgi:hypothetical protein
MQSVLFKLYKFYAKNFRHNQSGSFFKQIANGFQVACHRTQTAHRYGITGRKTVESFGEIVEIEQEEENLFAAQQNFD